MIQNGMILIGHIFCSNKVTAALCCRAAGLEAGRSVYKRGITT